MTEPDLDDVAFLTGGDSTSGRPGREGVAVCSQKRALCVTAIVLGTLLTTALVIAYAGPQTVCPCAGKIPPGYIQEGYNSSEPFQPIASNGQPFPWLLPTLPNNVRPNRYMLTIHPNLTTLDVKGQVTVEFFVEKETNFIVLHAQDLNITEKALVGPKGYALKILRILDYPPRQQLYIELRDKLRKKANYTLSIRWYSKMITEPDGFFVDQFETDADVRKILAATVLKPGSARKAFPCFDEPHLRASFRISLFRDRFHIGLSNSIVQDTDDVGFYMGTGLLRDDFAETPPLPPDSISWVISDFKRQLLDPSPIYQTINVTKDTHKPLLEPTKTPAKLTKADKKPFRNLTAVILSKNLFKLTNNQPPSKPSSETEGSASVPDAKAENIIQGNHTNQRGNGTEANHTSASDTLDIKTAPAYSFYAPSPYVDKGSFVLHTSRDILEYLQQWLGVAYPLSKLDFIALPTLNDDLTSSLGLIVCRTSFLSSPENVSTREYHMSVVKISEGIAKQYFGGLISPKAWKHVWLWEGIIKYLSRFILSPIRPQWPMNELFLIDTTIRALDMDALQGWESLHGGTSDTGNNEAFYIDKSASMLAMLQSAIGESNFRQCLGKFIKNFKYQTAEPSDLWYICAKQDNYSKNVKEMMNFWTNLAGFPLLNVSRQGDELHISQTPFAPAEFVAINDDYSIDEDNETLSTTTTSTTTMAPTPASSGKDKKRIRWTFPISYVTSNSERLPETTWFNTSETRITLNHSPKWIKLNHEQTGYYRVLYDEENWAKLVEQLHINHHVFSTQDRVGLVSDIFTLCHANLLSCDFAMDLISYFPKEQDWGPVLVGMKHLEKWRKILKYSECYLVLAEYIRQNLAKSIQELTWNDTGKEELKLLRPTVLLNAVLWEEPEAIRNAKELMNDQATIPPNLRSVAYIGSVLSGEIRYWQECWALYTTLRREKDVGSEERMELLRALGVTKDAWLQNRLLSHVITLPVTEIVQVLETISGTPTGGAMACRFLQAKWMSFQAKLGRGSVNFARVISAITQYGSTKFDYDELKSLVERFGNGPGMKILNMTLNVVAANVEWVSRSQTSVFSWIEKKYHF
ncbi:endoplasmic reticulum aminopeptidase 2 [Uranotaenia lowii]|uniref:endoplasmic reticulum aminopeptidase 2 n=1 Tax=Uranotaenia lowii TaxID=190385 RepID=UPI002478D6B9|nr:endoplasmic reticulum aminopeptidase 2 [Uranotaenia lowii]XP_055613355.1 endoplasmic reticulum aminopeptidase 2 [Uranotaenia lowii]XP_055613356.1 endoplasmic reticulum aminopeptidase 2 [Uranotaenia lowii]XP_055613357.1 endoplasmic reticulum aminopeptidase 2 [Uranotaenia lowii]XP_055613358.1 endoplasmic reticulum aminopeptidase 2 [Uranotaenia lowii]XP_055613359.1 endoplasmic reticulum aminopeptidase 2 [Uranotaenia lowii]